MRFPSCTLLIYVFALCLTGCATPGGPQPPSLNIPKPIGDLAAMRKGDVITLTWTNPTDTTDGALLKTTSKVFLLRGFVASENSAWDLTSLLGEVTLPPMPT